MSASTGDGSVGLVADDQPAAAAGRAAARSGVRITVLDTVADLHAVEQLVNRTWRSEISISMLCALRKAGNFVSGAYRGDDLVGACVGFFGLAGREELHSHLAVTELRQRGTGVGWALKLNQRAWGMEHGVRRIRWTFDPLERRNAYVNLTKLSARPVEYLDNFYGEHGDGSQSPFPTDRLVLDWDLGSDQVVVAARGDARPPDLTGLSDGECVRVLERDDRDAPREARDGGQPLLLIGTPENAAHLRADAPGLALDWRLLVRHHLGRALADGAETVGFTREGFYVLRREPF